MTKKQMAIGGRARIFGTNDQVTIVAEPRKGGRKWTVRKDRTGRESRYIPEKLISLDPAHRGVCLACGRNLPLVDKDGAEVLCVHNPVAGDQKTGVCPGSKQLPSPFPADEDQFSPNEEISLDSNGTA